MKRLILASVLAFVVGCGPGPQESIVSGTVVSLSFSPDSSSVGLGFSSSGDAVIVPTGHSEVFAVVVLVDGQVETFVVSKQVFGHLKAGQTINIRRQTWVNGKYKDVGIVG